MEDLTRGESVENAVLPEKQFLSEEELLEIWEIRGMKFRIDDFYKHCRDRGLMPHFRKENFRSKIFSVMKQFFVNGETRRDPRFVPVTKRIKRL